MDGRGSLNDELVAHLPSPENLCDSVESCRRVVRRQIDRGADVIKFATTGGVNSGTGLATRMFDDEAKALVQTAHAYGRKVAVHAHGADGIKLALRAGADSIEHGTVMDDEILRLFKQSGAYYVPTLSTVNGYHRAARQGSERLHRRGEAADRVADRDHRPVAAEGLSGGREDRLRHRCRRLEARP